MPGLAASFVLLALGGRADGKGTQEQNVAQYHFNIYDVQPEELKWFPIPETSTDYREQSIAKILRNFRAPKNRRLLNPESLLVLVKVSRAGKLLEIKALRTNYDHAVDEAVFAALIRAIRATSFAPLPSDYEENDLTFAFDLDRLNNPNAPKSKQVTQTSWASIPTDLYGSQHAKRASPTLPITKREPEPPVPAADATPAATLAWKAWNGRQTEAIRSRFMLFAKNRFDHNAPISCTVRYSVMKDGEVDGYVKEKSSNVIVNVFAWEAVRSLNKQQSLLQFPPGSRCVRVEKVVTFSCPARSAANAVDISSEVVLMEFEMPDGTFMVRQSDL